MVRNKQGSLVRAGEGEKFSFPFGNRGEVKASQATGLRFGFFITVLPPRTGMPFLHLHRSMDEAFQILEGSVEYRLGEHYVTAQPGDAVLIPHGVPHCFRALGPGDARLVLLASPPEAVDMILDLSRSGQGDPNQFAAFLERYDSELLERHPHWAPKT